ncbi:MAG: GNAT family N-acetyltransferase [Pseudomonadota bacterium]
MAALVTQAGLEDLDKVVALVTAFHAEEGLSQSDANRTAAVRPLLRGSPLGELHLIGPKNAPIGYIAISHGYSIEFGGPDAFIDEFYIRPAIRKRGMGGEVIEAIVKHLMTLGTRALHLEVATTNDAANRLYTRRSFIRRSGYNLMTRVLD